MASENAGGPWIVTNAQVYNNTFAGISQGYSCTVKVVAGSNNFVRNNLWYNVSVPTGCAGAATCSNNAAITNAAQFVNAALGNFRLASPTVAGMTLPSPFNIDPDGKTRGAGVWDIGAYEY